MSDNEIDPVTLRKLALLRVQLYTAAQELTGKAADEFWQLIDELSTTRDLTRSRLSRVEEDR